MKEWFQSSANSRTRRASTGQAVLIVGSVVLVALAAIWLPLDSKAMKSAASVALLLLGFCAVFWPEAFGLLPIASVEVAGVKVVLREQGDGGVEVSAVGTADERVKLWLETKMQLDARLGFLVKHFFPLHDAWLAPGRVPGSHYANFGTLTYDGYLSEEDVATVFRFGSLSQTDLALLDREELDALLSEAVREVCAGRGMNCHR